jgi:hypothetical protein
VVQFVLGCRLKKREDDSMDAQAETVETLRQLTLQIMLISAGVFGIVGGFVSTTEKAFSKRPLLGIALFLFASSAVFGYLLHGAMISLLHGVAVNPGTTFDPFSPMLTSMGVLQIGTFVLGGLSFAIFVVGNVR